MGVLVLPFLLLSQTGQTSDEDAIRGVVDQFMEAWNHHDAKAFAGVFSKDADLRTGVARARSGRAKVAELHAPVFATIFSKSPQEYTALKCRFIRSDVAAVDVQWK